MKGLQKSELDSSFYKIYVTRLCLQTINKVVFYDSGLEEKIIIRSFKVKGIPYHIYESLINSTLFFIYKEFRSFPKQKERGSFPFCIDTF